MTNINGYVFEKLNNDNSGFSKWGFAMKGGKEYFIKELLTPVYPLESSVMSAELFNSQRQHCFFYETRFKNYYTAINQASCGNLVRIVEFFRYDSRYYVVTEKIDTEKVTLENIVSSSLAMKLLLLRSATHCFSCLHGAGIVHFDVKTANILVKRTRNGRFAAKLIDFDAGYFKNEEREEQELGGDLTYLAPETFLGIMGQDIVPDEKSDIFALGLVFHEYMCGNIPTFDTNEYEYPYEVALDGGHMEIDKSQMPPELAELIATMLRAEPGERPSADDILRVLNSLIETGKAELPVIEETEKVIVPIEVDNTPKVELKKPDSWFSQAGDL